MFTLQELLPLERLNFIQSLYNSFSDDFSGQEVPLYYDRELYVEEIDHAVSIGKKYTNLILQSEPIMAHSDISGYEQPVVALLSPWCISACDNQAFLFEASNRVTLIGEPANGTGAGFQGNQFHSTSFIDPLFIVKIRIPNYLFGFPVVTNDRIPCR